MIQETSLRFYWAARRGDRSRKARLSTVSGGGFPGRRQKPAEGSGAVCNTLDKTIALAVGRPFAIIDQQCLVKLASDVWLDEMSEEGAAGEPERSFSEPTLSLRSRLSHELAMIVGKIQERVEQTASAQHVPTTSSRVDAPSTLSPAAVDYGPLPPQPRRLHNLAMRLEYSGQPLADRFKWTLGPHQFFHSARWRWASSWCGTRTRAGRRRCWKISRHTARCSGGHVWSDEFAIAEVRIVELCIKKARQMWAAASREAASAPLPPPPPSTDDPPSPIIGAKEGQQQQHQWNDPLAGDSAANLFSSAVGGGSTLWDDPSYPFPEAGDLSQWENVLNSIMQDQLNTQWSQTP
ncbi:hypothetical protein F4809DRAFT_645328 [Biscogniauxia mediterranea]|nr:hypothetical protein F4809DRAFT_645328 [Biscogniauxia mediterranea]